MPTTNETRVLRQEELARIIANAIEDDDTVMRVSSDINYVLDMLDELTKRVLFLESQIR